MTRNEAIYAITMALWEQTEQREIANGTFGTTETSTLDIKTEVARALLTIGVSPEEIMQAIRRWSVEDSERAAVVGQTQAVWWQHAVDDALASIDPK